MASKFYAVKKGRTTGIFTSWDECKQMVDGFTGATYKSFKTLDEATAYMGWTGNASVNATDNANNSNNSNNANNADDADNFNNTTDNPIDSKHTAIAYVDGSYNIATGEYGSGVVFIYDDKETHLYQGFPSDNLASMRNVAGEIKGSEIAIRYAIDHGIKSIVIYHDYEGIAKWCNGEWKANKEGTIAYQNFYKEVSKHINIEFVKVKGHSGDKYNDIADSLAKKGAHVVD